MAVLTHVAMSDLEQLVDQTSVSKILQALVEICDAKAEHLRPSWQDETAAKSWEKDARRLDRVIVTIEN